MTQGWLGHDPLSWEHIALPIGISFFTFQKLSYMIDVYRGHVRPARNFVSYALYVALFPQLIAGPIIRYHDVADQLVERVHSSRKFSEGLYRFSIGLGKKVLIADAMGQLADTIFGYWLHHLPMHYAWIGIFAYSLQIYFDFSGYSDMAIGLGKMMGFDFLENFNRPYTSRNFTEFWHRWHISLSNWMREYVYIPLGGNRVTPIRQYCNIWIVFLLAGLWHGASWNFIVWGIYHGCFLTLDKIFTPWKWTMIPNWVLQVVTFFFVTLGWVFFRMETLDLSLLYFACLFDFSSWGQVYEFPVNAERDLGYFLSEIIDSRTMFIMGLATIITLVPDDNRWLLKGRIWLRDSPWAPYYKGVAATVVLGLAVIDIATLGYHPFIYFQF
ncbi:MAG: sugar O-acetyltransferase [Nitrospirales bacterium]|nr:MAG: sugar O-acetyltransferase [Nitrospirales bacterium]